MTFFDFAAQAVGFLGIGMNLWALQYNRYTPIMVFKTLGAGCFVIQYLMLGAFAGAAMDIVGVIRNLLFLFLIRKEKPTWPFILGFAALTLVLGLSTWPADGWLCLLAVTAKLLSTISYGIENPHSIRLLNLPSSMIWLVYNAIFFSIAGVLNECMMLVSIAVAEYRFRGEKPKTNQQNKE